MSASIKIAFVSLVLSSMVGCATATSDEVAEESERSTSQAVVSGPAFYVDGVLYRTVGTPTDLPDDAPDNSFDIIYTFSGLQRSVAEAAPGQPGYNGGRWAVHGLSFPIGYAAAVAKYDSNNSGNFDINEEVEAAIAAGDFVDLGIRRRFVCTVVPLLPGAVPIRQPSAIRRI